MTMVYLNIITKETLNYSSNITNIINKVIENLLLSIEPQIIKHVFLRQVCTLNVIMTNKPAFKGIKLIISKVMKLNTIKLSVKYLP